MAITKLKIVAIASGTVCAAGTTKTAPGANSGVIDMTGKYGGDLSFYLANGAAAPGVAPTLVVQHSPDNGTTWYDYYPVAGDTFVNSTNSGTIQLDAGLMYVRVLVFGNTTNAITAQVDIAAITAV